MTQLPDGGVDRRLVASWGVLGGVDEVGRGALAGPLAVGLVVVDGQLLLRLNRLGTILLLK